MEITNLTWLTSCCNCGCSGGNTMRCNVCFGDLFPRWAKITKAEIHSSGRFFPRWAKTTRAAKNNPMIASLNALGFTWLTVIASVCVFELVSTTSGWAKATKTEQHIMKVCMQETSRHCYVCVAQCCSRRSWALPVVATTTKTTTWPQMWLEMKQANRRKLLNMSESKHAKTGKSRTQRWTSCHPSCGEHANHAGRRNMNLIPKQAGDAAR